MSTHSSSPTGASNQPEHLVTYYSEAGMDYEAWSKSFNMHFGYWKRGMNPFRLEAMLEEMNDQVLHRLGLKPGVTPNVLDLGCGLGATLRHAARDNPDWQLTGVTLVPWQVEQGRLRSQAYAITYVETNYTRTPFPDAFADGAWALESSCHASGYDKLDFIQEAARLLKPGAKLVVGDGFIKHRRKMNLVYGFCYRYTCDFWALETFAELEAFTTALRENGFENIQTEEISMRIAPSVLFVPWITLKYFITRVFCHRKPMTRENWRHICACVLSPILGLARKRFGYYLITATRTAAAV